MNSLEKSQKIFEILDNKKAINTKIIKIDDISVLSDYFVIATGTSSTHVKALAGEVEFRLKQEGILPKNIEGHGSNTWILLDYGDVVVHVFSEEAREYYELEKLWDKE